MTENLTIKQRVSLKMKLQRLLSIYQISEAELARQTHLPQATLHKLLSGKTTNPRVATLKALSDFFYVSIDKLLEQDGNQH